MMKRLLLSAMLFFVGIIAVSADPVIDSISAGNAGRNTVSGAFTEVAKDRSGVVRRDCSGTLVFTAPGSLEMTYAKPSGDLFSISGDTMKIRKDGVENVFDLRKNVLMRSLRDILIYSFSGNPGELPSKIDADLSASKQGGFMVVTMTARKKAVRGYSKVVLYYATSDSKLRKVEMTEWSGIVTTYEM